MFPLKDSVQHSGACIVTWLLVLLNVLCFAVMAGMPTEQSENLVKIYGLVPRDFVAKLSAHQVTTLFSSMFLHAGIAHLAGNMWFLWLFGDGVEDRLGKVRYLILYFGAGIIAAAFQILVYPSMNLPMIGASGAISGVLGAYLVLFPKATVSTFLIAGLLSRIIEIPAAFYLGLWLVMQLLSGFMVIAAANPTDGPQIAFWAHIGGFLAGMIFARVVSQNHYGSGELNDLLGAH